MNQYWSPAGVNLAKHGRHFNCPHCGFAVQGQRFCPRCETMILYPGETEKSVRADLRRARIASGAEKLGKAGDALTRFGCASSLGCALLVIIGLLILLLL